MMREYGWNSAVVGVGYYIKKITTAAQPLRENRFYRRVEGATWHPQ
jgi:hypothetical protein